jgi:putative addiction module component (TIGR02574 family)
MSVTFESLSKDALDLPADQRLTLAHRLLESIEFDPDPAAEAAWEAEIVRRIERLKSGEAKVIPAAEVFARLREIAPDR